MYDTRNTNKMQWKCIHRNIVLRVVYPLKKNVNYQMNMQHEIPRSQHTQNCYPVWECFYWPIISHTTPDNVSSLHELLVLSDLWNTSWKLCELLDNCNLVCKTIIWSAFGRWHVWTSLPCLNGRNSILHLSII